MQEMLRKFKVPAGLNDEEVEQAKEFFAKEKTLLERAQFWKKEPVDILNDHSRVMYLMSSDNKFLAFYQLDIAESELKEQIIEDIGTDIGQRYLGTGKIPVYTEIN